jgi:hypothetical protein
MKRIQVTLCVGVLVAIGLGFSVGESVGLGKTSTLYELRTYTTLPGRLEALHKRFAEHTLKLFADHGIKNEAYWVPTDDARKHNTLIYLVSHESREAADQNWKAFAADPRWIKVRDSSTSAESGGKILAKRPERVFMESTDYSPLPKPSSH